MGEIVTEYPGWFLVLCILGGAIYATSLYLKDRLNSHFTRPLLFLLAGLRFLAVTFVAFFLLEPLLKSVDRKVEKPIVVIAQDNSESIVVGKDSAFYKNEFTQNLQNLATELGEAYDLRTFRFGESVDEDLEGIDFSEKYTDFDNLRDEIYNRFANRNLGAVVVASDGLYNKGSNPAYSFKKLNVPIFAVAMGDTATQKDVVINEVAHNRLAYLGNKFPLEIALGSKKYAGQTVQLRVSKRGKTLHNEPIKLTSANTLSTHVVLLEADKVGLQKFTVTVSELDGEVTYTNNRQDIFIDVLDSRQKILILGAAIHPDIGAIRKAIESNENYEVTVQYLKKFTGDTKDFNLVITHNLPTKTGQGQDILEQIEQQKTPHLFVAGASTRVQKINELRLGVGIAGATGTWSDATAYLSKSFSLFKLDENTARLVRKLPPLSIPFGDWEASAGLEPLLNQRVGLIETNDPVIGFFDDQGTKKGIICGEGLWRWRMFDFLENNNHKAFDEIITKTVQYLAAQEDRSLFRVENKNDWLENEAVLFTGEVYNQSYEAVQDKDVQLEITDEENNKFTYTFSPSANGYKLSAGRLAVGNYSYVAKVQNAGKTLTERGEFSVSPIQLEQAKTQANHQTLLQLAENNSGTLLQANEISQLAEKIKSTKEIVTVSYEQKKLSSLINVKWLLFAILAFLCLEWLLRKRAGAY